MCWHSARTQKRGRGRGAHTRTAPRSAAAGDSLPAPLPAPLHARARASLDPFLPAPCRTPLVVAARPSFGRSPSLRSLGPARTAAHTQARARAPARARAGKNGRARPHHAPLVVVEGLQPAGPPVAVHLPPGTAKIGRSLRQRHRSPRPDLFIVPRCHRRPATTPSAAVAAVAFRNDAAVALPAMI